MARLPPEQLFAVVQRPGLEQNLAIQPSASAAGRRSTGEHHHVLNSPDLAVVGASLDAPPPWGDDASTVL